MSDAAILQVFALAYLAVGIGGLTDKKMLWSLVRDFEGSRGLAYLSWLFALVIWAAIVSTRTDSSAASAIIVSVLWYVAVAKGFFIIAFPKWTFAVAEGFTKSRSFQKAFPYFAIALSAVVFAVAKLA